MTRIWINIVTIAIGVFFALSNAWGLTPQQLRDQLASSEPPTVIDIRSSVLYSQGSIPGALNIPQYVIGMKRLPAIGRVVVCGDGTSPGTSLEVVEELNARDGIEAEILMGGFAAWEALNFSTTGEKGLRPKKTRYLSHKNFDKIMAENGDVVLLDLRTEKSQKRKANITRSTLKPSAVKASPPVTDLAARYPNVKAIKALRELDRPGKDSDISKKVASLEKGENRNNLYVLVDDGDGESEKVADALLAAGVKRIAILAGGENVLTRNGRPGSMKKESRIKNN